MYRFETTNKCYDGRATEKTKHTWSTKFTNLNEFTGTTNATQRTNTIRIKLPKIAQLVVFPFTKQNVSYHEIKVKFVGFGFDFSIYRCRLFSVWSFFPSFVPHFSGICLPARLFRCFAPFLSVRWQFWLSHDNSMYVCIYQLIWLLNVKRAEQWQ